MVKVVAVIVTYNRLEYLKQALEAVKAQSQPADAVIVIDNGSTDSTSQWLREQHGIFVITQQNSGGSGGFYTGIKAAVGMNADWVWVMDDDTIPESNALEALLKSSTATSEKVGFVASKCIWTDGDPHLMNIPAITPTFNRTIPFNKYDDKRILLVENCSFVSMLISSEAIKTVGLPYKEFFIWGDDQEYSRRITKQGYLGLYFASSVALHKTPINYFPDFYRDTVSNLWKHSYGFRNEFFMVKKNKGFLYYIFWLVIKVTYTSVKIIKIRKDNRLKFIKVLATSAWRSISFNPSVDYISN